MLIQTPSDDPLTFGVFVAVVVMIIVAVWWMFSAHLQSKVLRSNLTLLRQLGRDLPPEHRIRKRLESTPVGDLSFEEIAHLPGSEDVEVAAEKLVKLRNHLSWIERFAQLAIYLGIFAVKVPWGWDERDLDDGKSPRCDLALAAAVGGVGFRAAPECGPVWTALRAGEGVRRLRRARTRSGHSDAACGSSAVRCA